MDALKRAQQCADSADVARPNNQVTELQFAHMFAAVSQAESLQRIAECLETLVEAQTPDAGDPAWFDNPLWPPDWSKALHWAQWCTLDQNGRRGWYEREPVESDGEWKPQPGDHRDLKEPRPWPVMTLQNWRELKCRRPQSDATPDAGDATPDPLADLAPDWSQAPEWAQWYAVDEDGRRDWYECKPLRRNGFWIQAEGTECEYAGGADGGLPAYVDWRTLKWQRPQAQGATEPDWLPE